MRRRVGIDYEDHYYSDLTGDFSYSVYDTPYALYNDDVWQRYLDACAALNTATEALTEAMVDEPLDDVERAFCKEYKAAYDVYAGDKAAASGNYEVALATLNAKKADIYARALAYAKTRVKP